MKGGSRSCAAGLAPEDGMTDHVQRRPHPSGARPAVDVQEAGRDALDFATLLGSRLAHADDGLALATVLTSARRVVALVESRGLDGDVSLRIRDAVDLGDALHRVVTANRMAFTARGVALTTDPAHGVLVATDELGLDVAISVLCCWAVLRAAPGSAVHASVRAVPGAPRVRVRLAEPATEDGCIRVARSLAVAIGAELRFDEDDGVVEIVLPPA
jgi:hypothetical protein